jgi:hypothetical protein
MDIDYVEPYDYYKKLRIKSFKAENWEGLEFPPLPIPWNTVMTLFGKNSTGKSSFVRLVKLIRALGKVDQKKSNYDKLTYYVNPNRAKYEGPSLVTSSTKDEIKISLYCESTEDIIEEYVYDLYYKRDESSNGIHYKYDRASISIRNEFAQYDLKKEVVTDEYKIIYDRMDVIGDISERPSRVFCEFYAEREESIESNARDMEIFFYCNHSFTEIRMDEFKIDDINISAEFFFDIAISDDEIINHIDRFIEAIRSSYEKYGSEGFIRLFAEGKKMRYKSKSDPEKIVGSEYYYIEPTIFDEFFRPYTVKCFSIFSKNTKGVAFREIPIKSQLGNLYNLIDDNKIAIRKEESKGVFYVDPNEWFNMFPDGDSRIPRENPLFTGEVDSSGNKLNPDITEVERPFGWILSEDFEYREEWKKRGFRAEINYLLEYLTIPDLLGQVKDDDFVVPSKDQIKSYIADNSHRLLKYINQKTVTIFGYKCFPEIVRSSNTRKTIEEISIFEKDIERNIASVGKGVLFDYYWLTVAACDEWYYEHIENYLHPKATSELFHKIVSIMEKKKLLGVNPIIFETHSESILIRIQKMASKKKGKLNKQFCILSFSKDELTGVCRFEQIPLKSDGTLYFPFPDGFAELYWGE